MRDNSTDVARILANHEGPGQTAPGCLRAGVLSTLLLAAALAGCDSATSVVDPGPVGRTVSDFSLQDVNPTSPHSGALVSPRDYLGQISAWYFGHST